MVAPSPPIQPALRVMVPAGTTAGAALRAAGAPPSGPDALVVARDLHGELRDLSWAPESDTEVEAVAASSPD
ncbi:MAG TPA: threonine--tRNA ligase, partial [Pseudonocardiaceae bacterium]